MTYAEHASTIIKGALPADLIAHLAAHARDADLLVEETDTRLVVTAALAQVRLERTASSLRVNVDAQEAVALQSIRDYLLHMLDHAAPGVGRDAEWQGDIARDRPPLNFCTATLQDVRRVAPNFLRVELACADTGRLAGGKGMHFSLLLPPQGRAPVWPRLDGNGRTVMPRDADALHRAAYTFVDLDPVRGRFTFDIFEHQGGRVMDWARTAQPGSVVGITGPGSGDFPTGQTVLMAGDETALPAIRRILEQSPAARRGTVLLEVGSQADVCDMTRPKGVELTWINRDRGETLWDRLDHIAPPEGPDRFVWVAAEKELIRKAKARFCGTLGIGRHESYFAYYWER